MLSIETIARETRTYLRALLTRVARHSRGESLTGLSCLCFPSSADFDVAVRRASDGEEVDRNFWLGALQVREKRIAPPAWKPRYEKIVHAYYDGEGPPPFETDFEQLLDGVCLALVRMERAGELAAIGFARHPLLEVLSEDDADLEPSRRRLRRAKTGRSTVMPARRLAKAKKLAAQAKKLAVRAKSAPPGARFVWPPGRPARPGEGPPW